VLSISCLEWATGGADVVLVVVDIVVGSIVVVVVGAIVGMAVVDVFL